MFRKHQRLTPERLNRIHDHYATRMRHALLGLAGPGVVYGYAIDTDADGKCRCKGGKIRIGCGLAIDHCGRMLHWPGGWVGVAGLAGDPPASEGWYTLSAHYAERLTSSGSRRCCGGGADWIREGVVFSLHQGCREASFHCPGHDHECVSTADYICGRLGAGETVIPPDEHLEALCEDCGELCAVGSDDWLYDPEGLPLACVEVCRSEPGDESARCLPDFWFCPSVPQTCAHRPFVVRNPLLYELIRGCHVDLARVESLSWQDWFTGRWEEPVAWADFSDRFPALEGESNEPEPAFTIMFTKPIRIETLHPASVFLRALIQERRGDYWEGRRIPYKPEYLEVEDECARGLRMAFEKDWLQAEIHGRRSTLDDGARIELVVRGSLLRDRCGCMLDARPLDIDTDKPGQAMPGDDFVAVFRVAPPDPSTQAERGQS